MSSHSFLAEKWKLVQPPLLPQAKVSLAPKACEELLAQQLSKNEHFKQDLNSTWQQIDDAMKTIALANHKSINYIQCELYLGQNSFHTRHSKLSAWNTFCWKKKKEYDDTQLPGGKNALMVLVQQASEEYKSLSMEEKKALIEEYAWYKEHKTFGLRATTKSKVNDIMQTLKAVKNELTSLRYCTGAETMCRVALITFTNRRAIGELWLAADLLQICRQGWFLPSQPAEQRFEIWEKQEIYRVGTLLAK
ncbi:hypothetical protein F5141DRAFT_1220261 [Pisolithus sp. B1]|nr:hypothetical protein F5141DRAFT_1220261 [Pisolithus sp. B1]